jgi:hypothetical protein
VGYPSSALGAIGAVVASRKTPKTPSKRIKLNSNSLRTILDTLREMNVSYAIVNLVIIPVWKSREEANEFRKRVNRVRGIKIP